MIIRNIISILIIGLIYSCSSTRTISEENNLSIESIYTASYSVSRDGELARKTALKERPDKKMVYDDKGGLIEYVKYEVDGTIYKTIKNLLNKNGDLIKREVFDNHYNIKYYILTEFDNNDSVQFYRTYSASDDLTDVQENQYDSMGNIVLILRTDITSKSIFKTTHKYNSKNQLINRTTYNSDGMVQDSRTFIYDDKGNEIESVLTRPSGDYTKFVSKYDKYNNLITQYWFDDKGTQEHLTSFSYIYDKKGNWISRKRYSGGKLGYIWERQIEYN